MKERSLLAVGLIGLVVVLSGGLQSSRALAGDRDFWIERDPLPSPRQEIYPAMAAGRIYVVGGFTVAGATSQEVDAYDIATGTWHTCASLPAARNHIFTLGYAGCLYALGGFVGWVAQPEFYCYDPDSDSWSTLTAMPQARGEHVVALFEDKFYICGGRDVNYNVTRMTQVYDPVVDEWTVAAAMPTARAHAAVAVVDSLIHVIGGRYGSLTEPINMTEHEAYSPLTNQWYTLAPLPTGRGGHAAAAHGGAIYVFGGEILGGGGSVIESVLKYTPADDAWEEISVMPTPRHGTNAVTVADTIFVVGGADQAWLAPNGANEGLVIESGSTPVVQPPPVTTDARLLEITPNPFNPQTKVTFAMSRSERATVTIYGVTGRRVALLAERTFTAGEHSLFWDGRDQHGRAMPSGTYLVQLETRVSAEARKVLLLR